MEEETKILTDEAIRLSDKLIGELRQEMTKHLFSVFGYILLDIRNFQSDMDLFGIICSIVCGIGIGVGVAKIIIIAKHLSLVKGVHKTCKELKMIGGAHEKAKETDT